MLMIIPQITELIKNTVFNTQLLVAFIIFCFLFIILYDLLGMFKDLLISYLNWNF